MIWLSSGTHRQFESKLVSTGASGEYVLVTEECNGTRDTERFRDAAAFRLRLEALEQQLESNHWTRTGPFPLRDGWKL